MDQVVGDLEKLQMDLHFFYIDIKLKNKVLNKTWVVA